MLGAVEAREQALPPPVNPNPRPSPVSGVAPPVEHQSRPGHSGNKGGRPPGASTLAPFLREMAANPNEYGEGAKAVAAAQKLVEGVLAGDRDAVASVLAIMERTDGPIVKETRNENTHVVQGIELIERRVSVKDLPKLSSAEDT